MNITGKWFSQEGHVLLIEGSDRNIFTGDFCVKMGNVNKKIPIKGAVLPRENGHWPLVFLINWGQLFEGAHGATCFQIDWGANRSGISFDMQWTKITKAQNKEHVASGVLRFCRFDFEAEAPAGKPKAAHPFFLHHAPILMAPDN